MTAPTPKAWPALLTSSQLAVYLNLPQRVIERVCPVSPVDLGESYRLWFRQRIDAWVLSIPTEEPPQRPPSPQAAEAIRRAKKRTNEAVRRRVGPK